MNIHGPDLDFCPVDYSKLYSNNSHMSQNSVSKFYLQKVYYKQCITDY